MEIGVYELRRRLTELLVQVQDGAEFTITKMTKGAGPVPVARIVPIEEKPKP